MLTRRDMMVNRRDMLRFGAAAGVTALGAAEAIAKAPFIGKQTATFYRFKLGNAEATIISDGVLPLGDPHKAFLSIKSEEIDSALSSNFLPLDNVPLEQNTLVLNTGDKIILFDNGMGVSKLFGDGTGKLLQTMRAAGIDPADVDIVLMSHAHIDHCGGCIGADGKPNFPNAQYFISELDYNFWTDPAKTGNLKPFLEQAVRNLVPIKDRITWIKDGMEVAPGVHAMHAPGHTVGHTIFMIENGNDSLAYIADVCHHPILLLERPRTEFAYDTDPHQAMQTRLKVLATLEANKTKLLAYHFAWPGIGHIAKAGDGYRWFPAHMDAMYVSPI